MYGEGNDFAQNKINDIDDNLNEMSNIVQKWQKIRLGEFFVRQ